ncbi:MAG: glutamyl-tRNA reductase, partial [Acidothermales bacterium]|nr:glutamyl-tRNA reductase [Acidothermales bacterium]
MTLLVVGLNHRTATVDVLERAVAATADGKVTADLADSAHVGESAVLSTCNRVELYADVPRFHPGVAELSGVLERHSGVSRDELAASLYVHYEDRAIQQLFGVACGLDSMVVGEPQILGQVRQAMRAAEDAGTLGPALGEPFRRALRAGKRARSETGIDAAGGSLVTVALDVVTESTGDLAGLRALVVGAGAMGALSVAALRRRGADVVVANRSLAPARRLARDYG